ncbi:DUF169 domain-containing protein [Desulfurispirillum indicum]|uniref:DUF169 domain-containing protein n=1 Tax=Desulfurispirillum indicum TaxID=936456 RepID=UPI001CFB9B31|nr:DUF169 domain-containing protein [Desulfurispirillum indicum]UCZ55703.1 DUF169 domain-containing protein [Desulfurispirillum indicum]
MHSKIREYLKLETQPVATLWLDRAPEERLQFEKGRRGCILSLIAASAKGRVSALDHESFGCPGGGVGMGYGNQYENFPGGIDCFARFLSSGNKGYPKGEAVASALEGKAPQHFIHEYLNGEGYIKTPELVEDFMGRLGFMDIGKVTVFKPLDRVEPGEEPVVVTIFCNADQLSALVVLCNSFQEGIDNVMSPFGAGCQSMGLLAYHQLAAERPKAIIGLFDITARNTLKGSLGENLLSFSVPYSLFVRMEEEADGSFLARKPWQKLTGSVSAG